MGHSFYFFSLMGAETSITYYFFLDLLDVKYAEASLCATKRRNRPGDFKKFIIGY